MAAACFTVWPFIMTRAGFNWQTAAVVLSLGTTVVFLPLYRQFEISTFAMLMIGISAALLNGAGHIFFQKIIVSTRNTADPIGNFSKAFIVLVVSQVVIVAMIQIAKGAEKLTTMRAMGFLCAIGAVILLNIKQKP